MPYIKTCFFTSTHFNEIEQSRNSILTFHMETFILLMFAYVDISV